MKQVLSKSHRETTAILGNHFWMGAELRGSLPLQWAVSGAPYCSRRQRFHSLSASSLWINRTGHPPNVALMERSDCRNLVQVYSWGFAQTKLEWVSTERAGSHHWECESPQEASEERGMRRQEVCPPLTPHCRHTMDTFSPQLPFICLMGQSHWLQQLCCSISRFGISLTSCSGRWLHLINPSVGFTG